MNNNKRRNGKRLVFYFQNGKDNFDFQYLFMVCDFFGLLLIGWIPISCRLGDH